MTCESRPATCLPLTRRALRGAQLISAILGMLACAACSASRGAGSQANGRDGENAGNSGIIGNGSAGGPALNVSADAGTTSGDGGPGAWPSACAQPPVAGTTGEYCQGAPYDPAGAQTASTIASASGCGTTLWGIARDFIGYNQTATTPPGSPHPDFGSHYCCGNPRGTVLSTLGADNKPAYNPANVPGDYNTGVGLTGPDEFNQWYRDVPGVNLAYLVGFHLVPTGDGVTSLFTSKLYFPVDNVGFGNFSDQGEDSKSHNFGFTTELHTKFKYNGGEDFKFEGDDDLWVFINKKLAIDLGGIHTAMQGEIKLDEHAADAELVIGEVYDLDLFNAERHPSGSNFTITTSMTFVDCGVDPGTVR